MIPPDPAARVQADTTNADLCWFHRFGGDSPCSRLGIYAWIDPPPTVPGAWIIRLMRWCHIHRHTTDTLLDNKARQHD